MERTFAMIKPDGVQRGLAGEIIARYEKKGLRIVGMKIMNVTEEIANAVSSISEIQFMKMVSPIEPGLLAGFDNTEIKGFKSGHAFGPMIGSIPFICYIFELEDGADVAAFVKNLTDSANPRWNICVEAKQTVAGSYGNYVFFVMCPDSMQ